MNGSEIAYPPDKCFPAEQSGGQCPVIFGVSGPDDFSRNAPLYFFHPATIADRSSMVLYKKDILPQEE